MGCGTSSADQPQRRRVKQQSSFPEQKFPSNDPNFLQNITLIFEHLIEGCKSISAPSNLMSTVCLGKNSFPVVTNTLIFEETSPTELKFPVVSASLYGSGRVCVISQLDYLQSKYLQANDTTRFFQNLFRWIAGIHGSMTPLYLCGFDKQLLGPVTFSCQELGFYVENGSFKHNYSNYRAILLPSTVDLSDPERMKNLVDFVYNGGGLAIFYIHHDITTLEVPINKFLYTFNLAFTYCYMNEEGNIDSIKVHPVYSYVRDCNFIALSNRYQTVVKKEEIDSIGLDDIVTNLRYYIMVCDETYSNDLIELMEASWNYLNATGYNQDGKICPLLQQAIVTVLLIDLYAKLPPEQIKPIPEYEILPGKTGNVELTDYERDIQLQSDTWLSTGLWLPAGVIGEIEINEGMSDVHVHIGSHHESLIPKPSPWKRWPLCVSVFPLSKTVTKVVSSFGGIVYVAVNNTKGEDQSIHLKFKNFCLHPIADYRDPSLWQKTKDIEVPWGEIFAENIIFTLPSSKMREISDFSTIFSKFSKLISLLADFLSYKIEKPYRIVFDIDLPDDQPSFGYPLVFLEEDMDGILCELDHPSPILFKALTIIGIVSIREDCFDQMTETALAHVAGSVAMKSLWPDFDPLEILGDQAPLLFKEFWKIHMFNDTVLHETLKIYQNPDYPISDVKDDTWISFVTNMCRISKHNYIKVLQKVKPIPLNISLSVNGLEEFKIAS